jgi:glucokinase
VEKERMRILAGDIGGTHARLALYDCEKGKLRQIQHVEYASREYLDLREVVQTFLDSYPEQIDSACFGVAGPVVKGHVVTPNLPWIVQRKVLIETLNTRSVWLMNDIESAAYGIDELDDDDVFEVNSGKLVKGNRALICAGTGLGEAISLQIGSRHLPSASEGGHADFSPKTDFEMRLALYISEKLGHVSLERVLSGHGIFNIYQFLQTQWPIEEPAWLSEEMKGKDPSIAIMRAATTGESSNCVKARDLFIQFLGREAGNFALKVLATGGVYLGGGIASRMADLLKGPLFLDEFSAKGRMSGLLSNIPVRVILSDDVGLIGAARFAALSDSEKHERKAA